MFGNSLQKILDRLTETYPDLSNLRDSACRLDQYYLSTRYPDALPEGIPYEAYTEGQAMEAVSMASEIVTSARAFLE